MIFNLSDHIAKKVFLGIFLFILILVVFFPAINYEFLNWDDGAYIVHNDVIRSLDFLSIKKMFTSTVRSLWVPMTLFSFAVDYFFAGLDSAYFHFVNIVFHGLNTVLLFYFFNTIYGYIFKGKSTQSWLVVAFIMALLWGIHPLRIQSVAWVCERKDVLYAFFSLNAFLFYLSYGRLRLKSAQWNKQTVFLYGMVVLCVVFAMFSKPMAITIPLILVLFDFFPLNRWALKKGATLSLRQYQMIIEKVPFFVMSFLLYVLNVFLHQGSMARVPQNVVWTITQKVMALPMILGFYIERTFIHLKATPLYWFSKAQFFSFEYIWFVFVLVLFLLGCVFLSIVKKQWVGVFAFAFYFFSMLPQMGLIRVGPEVIADRFSYLSTICFFLLLGYLFGLFWDINLRFFSSGMARNIFLFLLVVFFTSRTVFYLPMWRDSFMFWRSVIQVSSGPVFVAHHNLGVAYQDRYLKAFILSDLFAAKKQFEMAVKIDPEQRIAKNNLNNVYKYIANRYLINKQYVLAEQFFKKAKQLSLSDMDVYLGLSTVYYETKQYQKAIEVCQAALLMQPSKQIQYNLNFLKKLAF